MRLSKNFKNYKHLNLYKKMIKLIFSKELYKSISILAQDVERESVIYLPEEDEFMEIIEKALNERLYEPYILLEKRVI